MNLIRNYLLIIALLTISCQSLTESVVKVTTVTELQNAIENAKPGDEIILKNGTWKNVQIELNINGTKAQSNYYKSGN